EQAKQLLLLWRSASCVPVLSNRELPCPTQCGKVHSGISIFDDICRLGKGIERKLGRQLGGRIRQRQAKPGRQDGRKASSCIIRAGQFFQEEEGGSLGQQQGCRLSQVTVTGACRTRYDALWDRALKVKQSGQSNVLDSRVRVAQGP